MRQHRSSTKSNDAHWSQRAKRAFLNREPEEPLRTIAGPGCWCGQPFGTCPVPHPGMERTEHLTPAQQVKEAKLALQEAGVCPVCRGEGPCRTCLSTGTFPPPKEARHG